MSVTDLTDVCISVKRQAPMRHYTALGAIWQDSNTYLGLGVGISLDVLDGPSELESIGSMVYVCPLTCPEDTAIRSTVARVTNFMADVGVVYFINVVVVVVVRESWVPVKHMVRSLSERAPRPCAPIQSWNGHTVRTGRRELCISSWVLFLSYSGCIAGALRIEDLRVTEGERSMREGKKNVA